MNPPLKKKTPPTEEELDAIAGLGPFDDECQVLCDEVTELFGDLNDLPPTQRRRAQILIAALNGRRKALHCRPCPHQ